MKAPLWHGCTSNGGLNANMYSFWQNIGYALIFTVVSGYIGKVDWDVIWDQFKFLAANDYLGPLPT